LRKQWRKAKKESEEQARPPRRAYPAHDHLDYQQLHEASQSPHDHRSQLGLIPTVPGIPPDTRYQVIDYPVDASRYHLNDRDRYSIDSCDRHTPSDRDREGEDREPYINGNVAGARQRYWPSVRPPISHTYVQHDPSVALSHPSAPHPSQSLSNPPIGRLGQDVTINRLPPDSTLLTPLPGYRPPSLLQSLDERQGHDQERDLAYPTEEYNGIYEDESKSGTDRQSGGEYDM
jgi:transcription factor CON7